MKVCAEPGCPELTRSTYCDEHRLARRRASDRRRPNSTARGYDASWTRTRALYLKHHPICEDTCCHELAVEVHHLDGRGPSGPLGHEWSNLEALCKAHHSQRTAAEQPGGWNA